MPSLKLINKCEFIETFRTSKVIGMFDVPIEKEIIKTFNVNIPIDDMKWNIGVIVGASGSGKTTIGKNLFDEKAYHTGFNWPENKSFVDGFNNSLNTKDIVESLCKVGFSSPPSWLLPFKHLSNGQKFRAEIARAILENDLIVFDEFTSVVDRQVAQIGSAAVQKFIRKQNKQFVALSCHYDILEWLEPDWVYDVSINEFTRGDLRRPEIKAKIYQCNRKAWQLFSGNHYLSVTLSKSSQCYVLFINDIPIGFCAVIHFPHPRIKNAKRGHRTVVLPDYQGIGLGNILSDHVAEIQIKNGFRYFSTTSHPAMINYRRKSKKWKMIRMPSYTPKRGKSSSIMNEKSLSTNRLTVSFEYTGSL